MPINFIPNDPLAQAAVPMRQQNPRPNRANNRARFIHVGNVPEGVYAPGTNDFLFWQCREAALAAIETWEAIDGPLLNWFGGSATLDLQHNNGITLNAFYDRSSLAFFEHKTGRKTTYSGASTDVVAHEAGHGLLDALRPDLWGSSFTEVGAFHEAFGDCMAIVTALADVEQRRALLAQSPNLRRANFLEATAEDLSDGVRRALGKNHPAAKPRHAFNTFNWQLPTLLPSTGKPDVLTSEIHSFGRVFSGCFYDTIANIFASLPAQNEATLWQATQTAFTLLVKGVRTAPETPRFLQSVGRAMVLTDTNLHNAVNHLSIRNAFGAHGIGLGSAAMLTPTAALAGRAPTFVAAGASNILAASTSKDLRERIQAPAGTRLAVDVLTIGGQQIAQVVNKREIELDAIDPRLKGVVAIASEPTLVGAVGNRAALLGGLPDSTTTADETMHFVQTLLRNDAIDLDSAGAIGAAGTALITTHAVRSSAGKQVLTRMRFVCGSECCA